MIDKLLGILAEKIIGKSACSIIDVIKDKKDVNEFKISAKLKLTINQTRNLLYKLYEQDVVSFIRKKDKQKGWYIYYWSLNTKKALELLARMKERELLQLSYLLKSRENKRFYVCPDCNIEVTEETALGHDFFCLECGNLLKLNEDKKKVEDTTKEIEKVKKLLEEIYGEINKLRESEGKKRVRRERRVKAQKKKVAKAGRIARKKLEKKAKKKPKKRKKGKR